MGLDGFGRRIIKIIDNGMKFIKGENKGINMGNVWLLSKSSHSGTEYGVDMCWGIVMLSQRNIEQDKLTTTFKYYDGPKASKTYTRAHTHTLSLPPSLLLTFFYHLYLFHSISRYFLENWNCV